jgi:hypothetical protein
MLVVNSDQCKTIAGLTHHCFKTLVNEVVSQNVLPLVPMMPSTLFILFTDAC